MRYVSVAERQERKEMTEKIMEEPKYESLQQVAEHASKLFVHHEKTNERDAFYSFTMEAMESRDPIYEALSDKMYDMSIDEDSRYEFTVAAIDNILESDVEEADECDVSEWADNDTDVYTSDLTEWLNKSAYNVSYLSAAFEEYGETDGFKALQIAQLKAREEVYQEVMNALSEFVNTGDSDDAD